MWIGSLIGWVIAGLIVGAIARLLVPGRQNMGIGLTIVLGIVGAMVGGFIGSMLFGPNLVMDGTGTYAVATAWPGWIMAIIGGVIVLWVTLALAGGDRTTRT
jgi:uncharacterized membrane protein YeaQ/YmgE (transglycosylase-associated protein family)